MVIIRGIMDDLGYEGGIDVGLLLLENALSLHQIQRAFFVTEAP